MLYPSSAATLRVLGVFALFLLAACQNRSEQSAFGEQAPPPPPSSSRTQASPEKPADASGKSGQSETASTGTDIFSSAAAVPSGIDSLKKFVRTAEMRFRVKNATASTLHVEDIVLRNGGFVVNSQLNTSVELRHTTPINRDSAWETTRFSTHSQLIVRVPYRQLDTTLRAIGRLSDFLETRHVNAEDISLQLLEKELTRLREGIYRSELAQSEENKAHPKADRARDSREATDQARIENLQMEDAIRFSTVRIDLYQLPQIRQVMVANTDVPLPTPPFAARMGAALHAGGDFLLLLFFGVVHLWGMILLAVVGYFAWKMFQKRKPLRVVEAKKSV